MSGSESLSLLHPLVRDWFVGEFGEPTDAQALGWPAIARGRHTLIAAPTGSGKTLAAFLTCIDGLVRQGLDGGLDDRTQVVYVSPLKALSNDIHRNLAVPLEGIRRLAAERGEALPEIRTAVRTGDTPASERQAMAKRPPHVLITTPESLYILLTSESGRQSLKGAATLILDELHAVVGNKRGSHLSLSVERLCALADGPVTRVGLSATQRPIDEVARFLVGAGSMDDDGNARCAVVDTGHAREMDISIELPPGDELGPITTHEQWAHVLDRIAAMVGEHRTTLVFVNTRRLVERVAHLMSERLGEEHVVAHHGSLSQKRRHDAERRLKEGQVRLCVATASLELGIDVGTVDLVCQIGSPRSISLLLQRVGRSGHHLAATPKGRLFPLTRDELLECMALIRGFARRNLDRLIMPPWPLDVLAQQIVAETAARECAEDGLFDLCRRAYPYRDLPREKYDEVLDTLSRGIAPREGRRGAYVHRDAVNGVLRARRGARLAALTGGGAIPDNADYDVIAEPDNTFVGTVNEDFAVESMRGDVFLLGNTPWRIRRVEAGRVRVEDASGSSPTIPFWLGEAPGRTVELSDELSDLRQELHSRTEAGDGVEWLTEQGFGKDAAEQAAAYVSEGVRVLGAVPTKERIVAERFFDEAGGLQLVIHSPFGSRVNRAWGMSLRKEICRAFDFELQAAATEDGINLSLGPGMTFQLQDVFRYIKADKAEKVLTQAILQAPLFGVRWRWSASRYLALLRFSGGRKVPAPIQRMRSEDLLAAVFPEQVACQDNAPPGDVEVPAHPLVFETMRDCLTEAMDVEGFRRLLADIESGKIEVFARDTTQPSVFSHQVLNAMPYAFLDDAPLEERRSRAVALRRALPEDARDLAALDPNAIASASANAWPPMRDAYELHDALLTLGMLTEADIEGAATRAAPTADVSRGQGPAWQADRPLEVERRAQWLRSLAEDGRAVQAFYGDGRSAWVASECVGLVSLAFPGVRFEPLPPEVAQLFDAANEDEAELALVRNRVECSGPFSPEEMAATLGMGQGAVDIALAHLEATGGVLRGRFTPGRDVEEFCDRRILARIHRDTVGRLRKEIEPVAPSVLMRFLLRWQHAAPRHRLAREGGLLDVIDQLQGFEAASGAWESDLLPARIDGYSSKTLDEVCLSGEVVWGRFSRRKSNGDPGSGRAPLNRVIPISLGLREDLPWLLEPIGEECAPLGAAGQVLQYLGERGASFQPDVAAGTGRLPSEVDEALWQLAAAGLATSDGFAALRGLVDGTTRKLQQSSRYRRRPRRRKPTSRWSLLEAPAAEEDPVEDRAAQLLRRYGIVFPEVLARESNAPRWRDLLYAYRRAEARGEIRGGRFVSGFVGEQFALPEAVEMLRSMRKVQPEGELLALSACDPLNLAGVTTPGPKVPAVLGNRVLLRDGVPVASLESGRIRWHTEPDEAVRTRGVDLLAADSAGQGTRRLAARLRGESEL